MTSPITFPTHIIGLMSGTSADGVDAALLFTDGREIVQTGASLSQPYSDALRLEILAAMKSDTADTAEISKKLTQVHYEAVEALIAKSGVERSDIKLIGFHGQTIRHRPEQGYTLQIGEPEWLAQKTGIAVVADFRSNDIKHGGQGAPLVPLYHAALARDLPKPVMVVNIGGVSNVTWVGNEAPSPLAGEGRDEGAVPRALSTESPPHLTSPARGEGFSLRIEAYDCGPGNALLDDWMGLHTGERCDTNGQYALRGIVQEAVVKQFLRDAFFVQNRARSLDRNHFKLSLVEDLKINDGAATLTAITAASIAWSVRAMPQQPSKLLVTGGGRHNPVLMRMLAARTCLDLNNEDCEILPVESVGWNGDMLEAEAFAYLAARSVQGLPLSLPSTTGVRQPVSGGVFYPAAGVGGS
jgi:anhydro-N-acetylmuramic acid kinase